MKTLIFIIISMIAMPVLAQDDIWPKYFTKKDSEGILTLFREYANGLTLGRPLEDAQLKTIWPSGRLQRENDARYLKEKKEYEDCLEQEQWWSLCSEPIKIENIYGWIFKINYDNETKMWDVGLREDGVVMWRNVSDDD